MHRTSGTAEPGHASAVVRGMCGGVSCGVCRAKGCALAAQPLRLTLHARSAADKIIVRDGEKILIFPVQSCKI